MRVLLISYFFPPYNAVGAVRAGKTAKYLLRLGHDVRVVTATDQSWEGVLPKTLPLEVPQDRVTYAGTRHVNRPVAALVRLLSGGRSQSNHIGWCPFALRSATSLVKQWRPDIIYASALPPTTLFVAHWLSARLVIPWVAEFRDLWADNPRYPPWRKRLGYLLERRVLASATAIVTVSEPMAVTLKAKYEKPIAVILNGFDAEDVLFDSETSPKVEGPLEIVYTGRIYYNNWRDPSPLFQAMRQLGSLAKCVRLSFYGPDLEQVRDLSVQYGLEGSVELNQAVPYSESLRLQQEADILLLLQWNDPREKGAYTAKFFEYIGARRPILAVGPVNNVAADLIRERNLGVALDNPEEIATQLRQWIEQKRRGGIPDLAEEATCGLTREEQTRMLERFLCNLLQQSD